MSLQFDKSFKARALVSEDEVVLEKSAIESGLNLSLTTEIIDIFMRHKGPIVFDQLIEFPAPMSPLSNKNGRMALEIIYGPTTGLWGILTANRRCAEQIPSKFVAIGEAPGGNLLLLERESGIVTLWLHDEGDNMSAGAMIAESFRDFLNMLSIGDMVKAASRDLGLDEGALEWKIG